MGVTIKSAFRFSITAIAGIHLFLLASFSLNAQDMLREMRSSVVEKINGKDYYIHTIKKGQTLYMISKAYGADVNEVIRENPEVKEGIKADQKIRIPVTRPDELPKKTVKPVPPKEVARPAPASENPPAKETPPKTEPPAQVEQASLYDVPCGEDKEARKDMYNVAVMLPLYLNETNQIDAENPPDDPEAEFHALRFLQFYEGFRIALDSLGRSGISARVFVYDVSKDTTSTRRLLRNPDLKNMDLIIGLLYQRDFQMVSEFARTNRIPLVNPVSERDKITDGNPMVIKAIPTLETRIPELAEFLSAAYRGGNIIIVRDVQFKERDDPEKLVRACSDTSMQVRLVDGYGRVFEILSKEKKNILVVFSSNKVFAIELMTKLNEFRNDYDLTVIGMPNWNEMDGLDPEYLVNLNTHMMSQSFVDYEEPEVKKFVARFQDEFKADPGLLAFQGFDVTFYFFSALYTYGKALDHCLSGFRMRSLQNDFQFSRDAGNGYENQHWAIYKYENYRVTKVTAE